MTVLGMQRESLQQADAAAVVLAVRKLLAFCPALTGLRSLAFVLCEGPTHHDPLVATHS